MQLKSDKNQPKKLPNNKKEGQHSNSNPHFVAALSSFFLFFAKFGIVGVKGLRTRTRSESEGSGSTFIMNKCESEYVCESERVRGHQSERHS